MNIEYYSWDDWMDDRLRYTWLQEADFIGSDYQLRGLIQIEVIESDLCRSVMLNVTSCDL